MGRNGRTRPKGKGPAGSDPRRCCVGDDVVTVVVAVGCLLLLFMLVWTVCTTHS